MRKEIGRIKLLTFHLNEKKNNRELFFINFIAGFAFSFEHITANSIKKAEQTTERSENYYMQLALQQQQQQQKIKEQC